MMGPDATSCLDLDECAVNENVCRHGKITTVAEVLSEMHSCEAAQKLGGASEHAQCRECKHFSRGKSRNNY